MPILSLKSIEDIKKLEGWKIEEAGVLGNAIAFRISHAAALEGQVLLRIFPVVKPAMVSNLLAVNVELGIGTADVPKED